MEPTRRPRVKVCCIRSLEEARLAVELGASALGLVSEMPSGPGVIPEEAIRAIAAATPPPVASVLLTSRRDAPSIIEQQRRTGVGVLQLVDRVEPSAHRALRAALPGVRLVQVVHVVGPESLDEAVTAASEVDAVLLDSGDTSRPVKELGGTGRLHDWRLSRRIREALEVPVFLAGGLRPENLAQAVEEVGPFALDVCSGVRTDGALDPIRLGAFFNALNVVAQST
jgi:phosphoribosylanthranilate isomerase